MGDYYKGMDAPKGLTVEQVAAMLQCSKATVRRMIASGVIVAWKPGGPASRRWLVDEVSFAKLQGKYISSARAYAEPVQQKLFVQGTLFD